MMTRLIKIRHSQSSKLDTPWPRPHKHLFHKYISLISTTTLFVGGRR